MAQEDYVSTSVNGKTFEIRVPSNFTDEQIKHAAQEHYNQHYASESRPSLPTVKPPMANVQFTPEGQHLEQVRHQFPGIEKEPVYGPDSGMAMGAAQGVESIIQHGAKVIPPLVTGVGTGYGTRKLAKSMGASEPISDLAGMAGALVGGIGTNKITSKLATLPDELIGNNTTLKILKYLTSNPESAPIPVEKFKGPADELAPSYGVNTPLKPPIKDPVAIHRQANPGRVVIPPTRAPLPDVEPIPGTLSRGFKPGSLQHGENVQNRIIDSTMGPVVQPNENLPEVTWPPKGQDPAPQNWAGADPPNTPQAPWSFKTYGPGKLEESQPSWPPQKSAGEETAPDEWQSSGKIKNPYEQNFEEMIKTAKKPAEVPPKIESQQVPPSTKSVQEDLPTGKALDLSQTSKTEQTPKIENPYAKQALEKLKESTEKKSEPNSITSPKEGQPHFTHEIIGKIAKDISGEGEAKVTMTEVGRWIHENEAGTYQPSKFGEGKFGAERTVKGEAKPDNGGKSTIIEAGVKKFIKEHPEMF